MSPSRFSYRDHRDTKRHPKLSKGQLKIRRRENDETTTIVHKGSRVRGVPPSTKALHGFG